MTEAFNAWIETLQTTTIPQADGYLSATLDGYDDAVGYCCLGVACYVTGDTEYLEPHDHALLPVKVADKLGLRKYYNYEPDPNSLKRSWDEMLADEDGGDGLDVYIDLSEEMYAFGYTQDGTGMPISLTAMNDTGFTFYQIADVITYFGIKEVS